MLTSDARMEPPIQALNRRSTVVLLAINFKRILCTGRKQMLDVSYKSVALYVHQVQNIQLALTGGVFWESSLLSLSVKPWISVLPPVTTTLPYKPCKNKAFSLMLAKIKELQIPIHKPVKNNVMCLLVECLCHTCQH